jgi:predicted transcriptional regulator
MSDAGTVTATATPIDNEPKSYAKILRDVNKNELQFIAYKGGKKGKVAAYVVKRLVKPGEGEKAGKLVTDVTERGASKVFETLNDAKVYLQKGIEAAVKAGWTAGAPRELHCARSQPRLEFARPSW